LWVGTFNGTATPGATFSGTGFQAGVKAVYVPATGGFYFDPDGTGSGPGGTGNGVDPVLVAILSPNLTITSGDVVIDPLGRNPLLAQSTASGAGTASLTDSLLQPVVDAAIARWAGAGLNAQQISTLRGVTVQVGSFLDGPTLGLESGGAVWISPNAAGWGWFTGATASPTPGRMDLLTVVEHELGHVLGFEHSAGPGVMEPTLAPGVRL